MLRPAQSPPALTTLILLSGLAIGTLSIFLPSLPGIAAEFAVEPAVANLALAAYAAATALLQIVLGPLSDRYGRRPVILCALGVYIAASLGCWAAGDIVTFLVFRMIQAAGIAGFVVSNAIVRDISSPEEAASRLGYVAMAWSLAPMLGPFLGGLIDEAFGWRASLLLLAAGGCAMWAIAFVDLGETNHQRSQSFSRQFRAYPELLRSRRFWGYAVCMAASVGAFYAFLGGAPIVASALFGLSSSALGLGIGSITAGFFVGNYLSGRFARRVGITGMMLLGRLSACLGMIGGLALFGLGLGGVATLFGACMLVGLGNGLTMPSANAGAMSLRPRLAGSAAGLAGSMTVAGGALISSLAGAIVVGPSGVYALLGLMLLCAVVGLLATLYIRRIDALEGSAIPHGAQPTAPDAPAPPPQH
ncbi:MAG: multidrug effflux MFS transporter [Pseudomonadota bacterium]